MQTGAVIVAAGMSSRMGKFKPMLNIGSMSIAGRIVATLKQAGVEKIVMITGFNADALERHLSNNGIVFLRNEEYAHTQMFDSAKIGFEYLRDKCDRILFTPVDIPLFTSATVSALIDSGAELARPVCGGETGHPIIIASKLIDAIMADSGDDGLKGALDRCGETMLDIEVEDEGILHDADTPQDYENLLRFHNKQLVRPLVNVSLAREMPFFDSQTAMLLTLIDETGSVRTACKRIQISYSTGWNILRTLETQMGQGIVSRSQGGMGGGSSELTEFGRKLLDCYEEYGKTLREAANELFEQFFEEIF